MTPTSFNTLGATPTMLAGLATALALALTAHADGPASTEPYAPDLLEDASSRASYSTQPGAGWDARGGYLTDGGANKLYIKANAQYRYMANFRDATPPAEDFTHGFRFRRARLSLIGTVADPKLSYRIDGDFLSAGNFTLFDAYLEYDLGSGVKLKAGTFKPLFVQEENNVPLARQAVEQSTVNGIFSLGYTQGADITWRGQDFLVAGAFTDGANAINSEFDSMMESDYALTIRGVYKWHGEWKQYDQFTSYRESGYAGFVGAALHHQAGGSTGAVGGATTDVDQLSYTIDASVKGDGWNVFGQFVGRHSDEAAAGAEFIDLGFLLQGGYFVSEQSELFARYSHVVPDGDRVGGDEFKEITGGVNYYVIPRSQAIKVSADLTYAIDDQAGSSALVRPNANTGIQASAEDGQIVFRLQFQFQF